MIGIGNVGGQGGGVPINVATIGRKFITSSSTAEVLWSTSYPCSSIILSADIDLGIVCVIGNSDVISTTTGMNGLILIPGNSPITVPATNANQVYVAVQENSGAVGFTIIK